MFGLAHFATILCAIVVVEEAGLVISPTVAGAIFDATGSYELALLLFGGTFAVAALLFAVVAHLPHLQFEAEPLPRPRRGPRSRGGRRLAAHNRAATPPQSAPDPARRDGRRLTRRPPVNSATAGGGGYAFCGIGSLVRVSISNGPLSSSSAPCSRIAGRTSSPISLRLRIVSSCVIAPSPSQKKMLPGRR